MGAVAALLASDDITATAARARDNREALEQLRETLDVLGELDRRLLVQVVLDALIRVCVDDPGAATTPEGDAPGGLERL